MQVTAQRIFNAPELMKDSGGEDSENDQDTRSHRTLSVKGDQQPANNLHGKTDDQCKPRERNANGDHAIQMLLEFGARIYQRSGNKQECNEKLSNHMNYRTVGIHFFPCLSWRQH